MLMLLNSSRSLREGHRLLTEPGLCVASRLRPSEAGREMSRNSEGDAVEQRASAEEKCETLAAATRSTSRVRELDLAGSQDLMCTNMMCEKVGDPCVCRLSRVLERLPAVEVLSLADNGLPELPASLWNCRSLKKLDLSNNQLQTLPGNIGKLLNLETLDISGNSRLKARMPPEVQNLRSLKQINIDQEQMDRLGRCELNEWVWKNNHISNALNVVVP